MNKEQLEIMKNNKGFIGALDQSGGSTPKTLSNYGVDSDSYATEDEMFNLVHEMRTRIIKSPAFSNKRILGAILFEKTMNSPIDGLYTSDYLWQTKGILPFLKVDEGLAEINNGVQLMKNIEHFDARLKLAKERNIFGTKMRSVIKEYNEAGIKALVDQQFEYAKKIYSQGFIPIVEPEVDINSPDKAKIEELLKKEILNHLNTPGEDSLLILKLTLPNTVNLYQEFASHPRIVRIVALSGGYSREKANALLSENHDMIASFSRGLTEGLSIKQTDEEFDKMLETTIGSVYEASIS